LAPTDVDGWSRLFASAFGRSRNPMLLADERRAVVEANGAFVALTGRNRAWLAGRPLWELVAGGPLVSDAEWASMLRAGHFDGEAGMRTADGAVVPVQWAATAERVGGGQRVLFVALSVSRWGPKFRRPPAAEEPGRDLTRREREIVRLVALGAAGPEIADELQISHETVRTHVRNAMEKLGARSRAHLVARALADGHGLSS
jgi:PAS domain S-box-containing protein